jgi:hypothetical protein
MDIKLSKDEIFTAISEGVQKAFSDAIWRDGFVAKWTDDMTDAISNGAYRAVYEAQKEKGDEQ